MIVHIPDSVHAEMREETRPLVSCVVALLTCIALVVLIVLVVIF